MAEWANLMLLLAGFVLYLVVGAIVVWATDKRLKSDLRHAQEYSYTTWSTTLYQQNRTGMLLGIFVVWPVRGADDVLSGHYRTVGGLARGGRERTARDLRV